MLEIQADEVEWDHCFLHLTEDAVVGEALNLQKDRLISDFRALEESIDWLLEILPTADGGSADLSPQSLESLSSDMIALVRMVILNTVDTDQAKAAAGWIIAHDSIWFIDDTGDQTLGHHVTRGELAEKLIQVLEAVVPNGMRPMG